MRKYYYNLDRHITDGEKEYSTVNKEKVEHIDGSLLYGLNDILDLLNNLTDEHHTMQELYDFRLIYNALLFNNWYKHNEVEVYKSRKHHDGKFPFDDSNWFIVIAILPNGEMVSNHYHVDYWDYFKIPSYPQAKDTFDGHTSQDVLNRLTSMINMEFEEV